MPGPDTIEKAADLCFAPGFKGSSAVALSHFKPYTDDSIFFFFKKKPFSKVRIDIPKATTIGRAFETLRVFQDRGYVIAASTLSLRRWRNERKIAQKPRLTSRITEAHRSWTIRPWGLAVLQSFS